MTTKNAKDLVSGSVMLILGVAYSWRALVTHDIGTLRRMGPSMFPFGLGVLLSVLGIAILLTAFFRTSDGKLELNGRSMAVVAGAVAMFALTIDRFGLIPSVIATAIVSAFAAHGNRMPVVLMLCIGLSFISWLIFVVVLRMPVELWLWRP